MAPNTASHAELATFLARRWSGNPRATVQFSDTLGTRTRLAENRIILAAAEKRPGDAFARYRQTRMDLWYESMRMRFCEKILSNDHAFGFVLNTMETTMVEGLGRSVWRGMDREIMFCHAYRFLARPPLGTIYGRARILEAFYQHFMFGAFKGEVQSSHFERVLRASRMAKAAIREPSRGFGWREKKTGEIIRVLEIDPLQTVPVSLPFVRQDMPVTERDVTKFLRAVSKSREGDFGRMDPRAVLRGDAISQEYRTLVQEERRNARHDAAPQIGNIRVPAGQGVDESPIYDMDLINGLKVKFREWKSGYQETHHSSGEEFDVEGHIDGGGAFVTDVRRSIKSKVAILLDHSASISGDAIGYKKATLGLCEVMSHLGVEFSVYAFSSQGRDVVCWAVKPHGSRWGRIHAKRLAKVAAGGSTPLAQVYERMLPALQAQKPDIFLTLTDGEPADPQAVRDMVRRIRAHGIRATALGLGPSVSRATTIAANLRRLGYERTLATSRLSDIPKKVLGILTEGS